MQWFSKDSPLKIWIDNNTRWKARVIVTVMYIAFVKPVDEIVREFVNRFIKCDEVRDRVMKC